MRKKSRPPPTVRCPTCREVIYDGKFLKSRILDFEHNPARAKCRRCKTWVEVPQVKCDKVET